MLSRRVMLRVFAHERGDMVSTKSALEADDSQQDLVVSRSKLGTESVPLYWPVTPLDATRVDETTILAAAGSISNWFGPVPIGALTQQIDT